MTLTHRLALLAMFAGAAAFAQSSTGSAGTSGDPSSGAPSTRSSTTGSTSSSTAQESSAVKMTPTAVLSMLQQVDKDEIRLAQMAQSKATSDKVKDYAKEMIDDHGALDKKVSEFATKNKLTLAESQIPSAKRTQLKTMAQDAERRLESATGAQFDREYMKTMSEGHGSVLANLDAALPGLKGQDKVYDLVKTARNKVEDHKKHADDILKDLVQSNATGGSGMHGSGGASPSPSGMSGGTGSTGSAGSTGPTSGSTGTAGSSSSPDGTTPR